MESDFVLPCNNSPVSVSIPQSYWQKGYDYSNCSTSCIFWGVSTTGARIPNVDICLLLLFFGKCLFHMCRHKNIYNLGVDCSVLLSKNLLQFQNKKATSKVKEFSTFPCMGRRTSHLTEIIPFDTHLTTWDQYPVFSFSSFLRDCRGECLQSDGW